MIIKFVTMINGSLELSRRYYRVEDKCAWRFLIHHYLNYSPE